MKLKLVKSELKVVTLFGKDTFKEVPEIKQYNLKIGEVYDCIYSASSHGTHGTSSSIALYVSTEKKWIKLSSYAYDESVIQLFEPAE